MNPTKRYFLVTLTPLTAIVLIATIWAVWLLPSVPDPMAVHFNANSAADGYLAPATNIVVITAMSMLIIVGFTVLARVGMRHGAAGRLTAGSAGFTVALLSVLQVELFRSQTGLGDATGATLSWSALGWCFGIAIVVGGLLAWVATPVPQSNNPPITASKPVVPDQGKAVWIRSETMHPGLRIILGIAAAMTIVFVFLIPGWITLLTAVITVVACLATWGWRLRVDAHGFSYRSFLGIPRGHIPHDTIDSVELIEVNPGNWGGWGWRQNGSGTGLITASGPGIRLTRTNGRILEVSTTDAPTAVGLLKHYTPEPAPQTG